MRKGILGSLLAVAVLALAGSFAPARADDFAVDPVHSCIYFKISHMGISTIFGRFNQVSGDITIDKDNPGNTSFNITINAESVDTNNKARDQHLRSPDFFNAKQFPTITFKSTTVKPIDDGLEVTGDLTFHGVTKPITIALKGGKVVPFQKSEQTGYSGDVAIKRADFGVDKFPQMLGENVLVAIGIEGRKK
jgi:polyisoprenoid-binding protein YceI